MISIDRRSLQHFDWALLALIAVIVAAGITNLFSATQAVSPPGYGVTSEFRRQLMALGLGVFGLIIADRKSVV